MAKPITQRELDREDLDQTVELGRAMAKAGWKPDLGKPRHEFEIQHIMNEVRAMNRAKKRSRPRKGRLIPIQDLRDEPVAHSPHLDVSLWLVEQLQKAMRRLTSSERNAIRVIVGLEIDPDRAIAACMPSGRVRRRAVAKMREIVSTQ